MALELGSHITFEGKTPQAQPLSFMHVGDCVKGARLLMEDDARDPIDIGGYRPVNMCGGGYSGAKGATF